MPRRTKADAEQTRNRLLDAAETLFLDRGVSRTSLNDIANAAGTTRGAIYWHFKDKEALFNAMMERVTLPLEQAMQMATDVAAQDVAPLRRLVDTIQAALQATVHDPRTRRVFEIATHKVEYVGEMHGVLQRRNECVRAFMGMTEQALATCAQRHNVQLPMTPDMAALGLHMLIDGLIHNWLLDPTAFDLEQAGAATMSNYLRGLGLSTQS